MKKHLSLVAVGLLAASAVIVSLAARKGGTAVAETDLLFSRVKMIIEFNDTAQDVGVQVLLDGEPWKSVSAFSPNGVRILNIAGQSSLARQGLTELFFESSEPSLDEVPLSAFLKRFPAGEYEFEGRTIDGQPIEGETLFQHVIPRGPVIVSPVSATEDPPVVDPDHLVIAWEPVTEAIHGGALVIGGYQVIVEQVEPLRVYSIDLPGSRTSVAVPPEFFDQRNALHKFEVLAIEAGGNQTITEGEFVTAP